MSINDPIGDFLTRIRNGQQARKKTVVSPSSRQREAVAGRAQERRLHRRISRSRPRAARSSSPWPEVFRGQAGDRAPQRISTPSLRVYKGKDELPKVLWRLGVASSPRRPAGVSDRQAPRIRSRRRRSSAWSPKGSRHVASRKMR